MTHYPHPYDPKSRAVILKKWQAIRQAKCPIRGVNTHTYKGTYVEYIFFNKKGKEVHVPEFCLLVKWL